MRCRHIALKAAVWGPQARRRSRRACGPHLVPAPIRPSAVTGDMMVASGGELRQHRAIQPAGGFPLMDEQEVAAIELLSHPEHIHGVVAADGSFAGNKSVCLPVRFDERLLLLDMFGEKGSQCRLLRCIGAQCLSGAVLFVQGGAGKFIASGSPSCSSARHSTVPV